MAQRGFVISAIAYNRAGSGRHISRLEVHAQDGGAIGPTGAMTRDQVRRMIEEGCTFNTLAHAEDGEWRSGPPVRVVEVGDGFYLRSDANDTAEDNLASLLTVDSRLPEATTALSRWCRSG